MRKALGVAIVGCAALFLGAQFQQTQVQVVVADSLRALKFESLGAPAGSGEQFKVHEGTMAHLRRLQLEGKIIEIDSAGIIRIR